MITSIKPFALSLFLLCLLPGGVARAADCAASDRACLIGQLEATAAAITDDNWRDQTYRELAKTMAGEGMIDPALAQIAKVKNPDTQAMTIRGIGMAAADLKLAAEAYNDLFARLRAEADKIAHAPSHAIALTYIGMAQAFAGQNEAAMATAASMENPALRNKAYGEAAEVQAERRDMPAVLASLAAIDDPGYRDKEAMVISGILADRRHDDDALKVAGLINDPYKKGQALLHILTRQKTPLKESAAP